MASGIESVFSLHEQVLQVQGQRMGLITSNLANADTPNYKAQDIDFRKALSQAGVDFNAGMAATNNKHMQTAAASGDADKRYRVPMQPSLDGNTVDNNIEKTSFAEASMRYESTLTFLSRKIEGLRAAMRTQ